MSIKINSPQSANELAGKVSDVLSRGDAAALREGATAGWAPSLAGIMANSAEELTFQFSELREQSHKELETKSVTGASWARVVRIEKIRELFEQITSESSAVLGDRAKKLLEQISTSKDPYDAICEMESDPTMQYLILREAAHQAAKNPLLDQQIESAIQLVQERTVVKLMPGAYPDDPERTKVFMQGASSHIKADMASAPAIAAATPDSRLRALLRETYRDALVAADTPAEMALHLLEKYSEEEIPLAMRTLSRALSDDLKSKLASRQPGKFEAILKDLKSIQSINSAMAEANKVLRAVSQKGGVLKRSVVRVATDLIRLAHLNPTERFITDVLLGHVDGDKHLKLGYLSKCAMLFNYFPASIWPEEDSKDAWRDCITDYVNREDPRDLKAV